MLTFRIAIVAAAVAGAALIFAAADEPAKVEPATGSTAPAPGPAGAASADPASATRSATATSPAKPSLAKALAELKDPPDWFADTDVDWDTNRPWQEARVEVRRLLGGDDVQARQAVKLTWTYRKKGGIGDDGHQWPMYLFMGGEIAWAIQEYPAYLKAAASKGPTHAYLCFASCYAHFGEYDKALAVLDQAAKDLPAPPWRTANLASIHERRGDLYADMGQADKARAEYAAAAELYPKSDQPYGREKLAGQVETVRTKVEMLAAKPPAEARLTDGTFKSTVPGYSKDLTVTVTVKDGRIGDVKVAAAESIERGATRIVPRRIVEANGLRVDTVTGATVTSQAVVIGAYKALKQAGVK